MYNGYVLIHLNNLTQSMYTHKKLALLLQYVD